MTDPSVVAIIDQGSAVLRDFFDLKGVCVADPVQLHAITTTLTLAMQVFQDHGPFSLVVLGEWVEALNHLNESGETP